MSSEKKASPKKSPIEAGSNIGCALLAIVFWDPKPGSKAKTREVTVAIAL